MVPTLALFSAFAFVAQMFAIPLFGGTTGHPVGATLIALVLGFWPAVIGVSITLIVQALFFGDGGITAIGANCFNMAVVMPFVAVAVYRLLAGGNASMRRRLWAAAAAGYASLNISAFVTAVEFGIQPLLFRAPDGRPLYCPYPLSIAIPGMMLGHLLIAGPAEAVTTALALRFIASAQPELLTHTEWDSPKRPQWKLWLAFAVFVLATPLGLIATGSAWGEWGKEELQKALGFVPAGIAQFSELWKAPIPEYEIPGLGAHSGYVISGLIGVLLVAACAAVLSVALSRGRQQRLKERSLQAVVSAIHESLASERVAAHPGFLQNVEPRLKLLAAAALILAAASSRSIPSVLMVLAVGIAAGMASGVPPLAVFLRATGISVLFTAAFSLPAILNVITPGDPVLILLQRPAASPESAATPILAVTRQGLLTACLLILRVAACITWAWLAVATTRRDLVFASLRRLGIPKVVVEITAMTYRYLVLLLKTAEEMLIALKSRSAGKPRFTQHRTAIGGIIGALVAKASHLSHEVHLARVSRGYREAGSSIEIPKPGTRDILSFVLLIAVAVFAILLDRRLW
jgi:cobalt/nickel transport system permease protein